MTTELQALQNAVTNTGLELRERFTDDRRKKINRFYLMYNGQSISPTLDYEQMNHFILGFKRGKEAGHE